MVRFRYLLSRSKIKRVLLSWKVKVRKRKVSRLQFTIGSHQHYRCVLKASFEGWRRTILLQRDFRQTCSWAVANCEQRVLADAFQLLQQETLRVVQIEARGQQFAAMHRIFVLKQVVAVLANYRHHRYRTAFHKV